VDPLHRLVDLGRINLLSALQPVDQEIDLVTLAPILGVVLAAVASIGKGLLGSELKLRDCRRVVRWRSL